MAGLSDMKCVAWARVSGLGVAQGSAGCDVAQTGTGVYTVTLADGGVDATLCHIGLTLEASGTYSVAHTSDTVKTVSTFAVDGTTPTNKAFDVQIWSLQVA